MEVPHYGGGIRLLFNPYKMKIIKHDFQIISAKTARKDNTKYLGKDGSQAWRESTKIGEDWWACMIDDEELLPVKGKEYNIELSENDGFKNWAYKLLTKKEQVMGEQAQQMVSDNISETEEPPFSAHEPAITEETAEEVFKEPNWTKIAEGKVRTLLVEAIFPQIKHGDKPDTMTKEWIDSWVEYCMTGK